MTEEAWKGFAAARAAFKAYVDESSRLLPELREAQQCLVDAREGGSFLVETPVVYNRALDEVTPNDSIKLILVADNPGRREQMNGNRRYLVGPSGKIAEGFFRSHPELGIDFRRNAIILNKTPIHTPRTIELRELARIGGPRIAAALLESQERMAGLIRRFHAALTEGDQVPWLWIIGYSEMKTKGLFEPFSRALTGIYGASTANAALAPEARRVLLLRHFSMNQFTVDLRKRALPEESIDRTIERVGSDYRHRVLGW